MSLDSFSTSSTAAQGTWSYVPPSNRPSRKVVDIPFNEHVGIELDENGRLLRLPASPRNLNHIGTVHASALMALAEAASAEYLLRQFGPRQDIVPLVRRLEAKFCQPARGAITATAHAAEEALARFEADLARKGRAMLVVTAELFDEADVQVLAASVTWFMQVMAQQSDASARDHLTPKR